MFLLKLLSDAKHQDIIRWTVGNGEFQLIDGREVASQWNVFKGNKGERDTKERSYESLARSIRYYYKKDKKIILKVPATPYAYKFVCDLRDMLGYGAEELADLVNGTLRRPRARRYPIGKWSEKVE